MGQAIGNILAGSILFCGDLLASSVAGLARVSVDIVDCICGSGHNTARKKLPWHPQRFASEPVYAKGEESFGGLDVEAMLKGSSFPIKPEQLVAKAKEIIASEFGTLPGNDASSLAEDFQFVAPIIGPLGKGEFLKAFGGFKVKEAFPDLTNNSWFQVDPLEPNRVWFIARARGTNTGPLMGMAATGKEVRTPPQAQSMLFNEEGKCYTLTVGYCMDKRIGNTDGVGGVFALLKGIGKGLPFAEAQRLFTPSLRWEAFEHFAKAFEGSVAPSKEIAGASP